MSIGLSTDRLKTLRQSNNCQTRWFSLTPAIVVVPDGIIDSFDCQAWHDRVQGSNRAAKKTGATTDVAASLRRMWR